MSTPQITEFMLTLHKQLLDERKIAESTATAYIKALRILNEKKPFKNLTFLKKTEEIMKRVGEYAPSTQRTVTAMISSVLTLYKDKAGYKKVYEFYHNKITNDAPGEQLPKVKPTATKTKKEKENWIKWEDVLTKQKDLIEEAKKTTKPHWDVLLPLTILSLYVDTPPRRNQDYMDMDVVVVTKKTNVDALPKDKNYLLLEGKRLPSKFIFNKYKTSKTYGQQTVEVTDTLKDTLQNYLKHHPLFQGRSKPTQFAFLVNADGTKFEQVNAITRILNKVFGKNVGSSMLRHIFLSDKYDIKEMEGDATKMAHSLALQRSYMRHSDDEEDTEVDAPSPTVLEM
jgi:integrase